MKMLADTAPPPMGRLEELDGLRGLLALWVVVTHILCWCGFSNVKISWPLSHLWSEFIGAQPAVHVFIILSGFAISFLLHHRSQSYGAFIVGRFFRLYPVYLVCLVLGIMTVSLTPFILSNATWYENPFFMMVRGVTKDERIHLIAHTLVHLTMLHGLLTRSMLPGGGSTLLPPAWSISLEWQYYAAAYAIAKLIRSGYGILLLASVFWISLCYADLWANPGIAFLPIQLPLFLMGILSYHLYAWFCSAGAKASNAYLIPVSGLIICALISSMWNTAIIIWSVSFGCVFVDGEDVLANAFRRLRRTLLRPSLQWLGAISYPLYLIHWPLILVSLAIIISCRPAATSKESLAWLVFVGLPLMLGAATVLHKTLEMPLLRWGKKFGKREYGAQKQVSSVMNANQMVPCSKIASYTR